MASSNHADDDRVYVDLVMPSESKDGTGQQNPTATVTFRRTKGRDSLKRLSDILSSYIPVKPPPGSAADYNPREPLIEENEGNPDGSHSGSVGGGGYRTMILLNVPSLRLTDCNSREELQLKDSIDGAASASATIDGDITGVALSKSGFAFLTFKDSQNLLRLEVNPLQPNASVTKTCRVIQLKLRDGVCLVPTDVKVFNEKLFACGHLKREVNGNLVELSTVVRCDLDGRVELASKELPRPRFYGFDIDPVDGQLVVASPTPDGVGAQIFKMSDDFKRKLFKVQFGLRRHSWIRPEFVACLAGPDGGQCWVSVEESESQSGLASGQVKNRLLSFPLRAPRQQSETETQPQPIKSWMKVSSWKFEGIKPGRLLTLPEVGDSGDGQQTKEADRLLMLNKDQGNIHCVSQSLGCSTLTHPSSDGGQAFTAFCCLQSSTTTSAVRSGASAPIDILAATKDSLFLLQAL